MSKMTFAPADQLTDPAEDQPTKEQLEALKRFATAHGRSWKQRLSTAWTTGRDERLRDGALLRQVRNQLGPEWLSAAPVNIHKLA